MNVLWGNEGVFCSQAFVLSDQEKFKQRVEQACHHIPSQVLAGGVTMS